MSVFSLYRLVYPGAKKCFGPISDYKIDLSYKHQTEPQEVRLSALLCTHITHTTHYNNTPKYSYLYMICIIIKASMVKYMYIPTFSSDEALYISR